MGTELSTWLSDRVKNRGWSLRQTAKKAGLSHSTVARLANGEIGWTPDTCIALAKVFGEPLEEVFRLAGILPAKPAVPARRPLRVRETGVVYEVQNGDLDALLAAWAQLSEPDRLLVIDLAQRLAAAPRIIGETDNP